MSGATLGHEEYSFYGSLSEDELIQMAIEQSLAEGSANSPSSSTRQKTTTPAPAAVSVAAAHSSSYKAGASNKVSQAACTPPWGLSNPINSNLNRFSRPAEHRGYRRRYDGTLFPPSQPVVLDPAVTAIENEDEEALRDMIKQGKNLAVANKDGWLPLHEAAYYGKAGCLQLLLKSYPGTINTRTLQEDTALCIATCKGYLDCMRILLTSGADPDITSKSRETPLYKACERKNLEAVKMLVKFNANVNHRCGQGWTALHESVARNDIDVVDVLVKAGAKTETKNVHGLTPMFVAAQGGQVDALRYLTKCGADINTQANDSATALFEACKNGHTEAVEFLLSQGADPNRANKDGFLPLHVASEKGHYDIVVMLIPVTSRSRIKRSGISPLHLAAERNRDDVLEELIDAGYDVNFTLSYDRARLYEDRRSTPLYFSVYNNNIYATELLLEAGANPNVDIINPLLISIRQGCLTTMKMLLDHNANIDPYISTHPTSFPATVMFSMKCLPILKFLMDLGCDADSCFKCTYGSGPHPAEKPRRDSDLDPVQNKPPKIVQFCEMVSSPEINRWAGPIIDVLLDYVGNIQLCSRLKEQLDSYEGWACIKQKAEPPRSLSHLCRLKIRNCLGRERLKYINTLPLPPRLIRYLTYCSLCDD
ncbi:ankyrin repeat and SOCS box protein 2 [Protopterus annectens]|uniref:ankyrin repeat and SOCS box protein 2 n=1 Tax=Protopterus annectens TaxID=7888 RepID=UPI001CFA6F3E|nr:ankyrin repeat and SOCS box protein 2 [Protopterus annectens]